MKLLMIVTVCLAALLPANRAEAAPRNPNVVLIMCDDLGWGDPAYNGNTIIKTPNLDQMAAAGMKFNRFYAASAVCSPTRGSVMTGRHPYRYGVPTANSGHMKSQELTLAELLKKLGYATGHFGKWHLGTLTRTVTESNRGGPRGVAHYSPPWVNGFDVCCSTEAKVPTYDPLLKPNKNADSRGWDYITDKATAVPYGTHYWNQRGEMVRDNLDGDDSRAIMDRAIPFIEQAVNRGNPFLAVIWFHTPHLPVVAGPRHAKMYDRYDSYPKNYYGCVTAMDEQVGRLRDTLRKNGAAKNTLVAFCSDNGPEGNRNAPGSAGPFRGRKRDLFEGGVRVPGIIEWPAKIKPGSETDYPAVTSDYLPTILDIVDVEMPAVRPLDGVSLVPVLEGKLNERPRPIGFQFGGKVALTDNRYKLVSYPRKTPRGKNKTSVERKSRRDVNAGHAGRTYMLFDLLEDPCETTDIAGDHADIVREMTATLEAWQQSCAGSAVGNDYAD